MSPRPILIRAAMTCRSTLAIILLLATGLLVRVAGAQHPAERSCMADLNGDGEVGAADLAAVLGDYGPCYCPTDFNADHVVDEADRDMVFDQWGGDACTSLAEGQRCTDLDGDGAVGPDELAAVLGDFGACFCDADFNRDGTVDRRDQYFLISQFGTVECSVTGLTGLCAADFDSDGMVDDADLSMLIAELGPCSGCPQDLSGDGTVNERDLYMLKSQWGPCPPPPGMVLVPGGSFEMGCHVGACTTAKEMPVHTVNLDSFYMDVHEVTNRQFVSFLNAAHREGEIKVVGDEVRKAGETTPYCRTASSSMQGIEWDGSDFTVTPGMEDHPMATVSWFGAAAYCNYRSQWDGREPCYDLDTGACDFSSNGYRLPTEAEWEYAARGGAHDPYMRYPWGDLFDGNNNANYVRSGDPFEDIHPQTTPVGYFDSAQEPPGIDTVNGYGLYDMSGNVAELCHDFYDEAYYSDSPMDNPTGPEKGTAHVLRGGSWGSRANSLRCAARHLVGPSVVSHYVGFRVVVR